MLALENLHSNKGDSVIYEVAQNTSNKSVNDLCAALSIKSFNKNDDLVEKH